MESETKGEDMGPPSSSAPAARTTCKTPAEELKAAAPGGPLLTDGFRCRQCLLFVGAHSWASPSVTSASSGQNRAGEIKAGPYQSASSPSENSEIPESDTQNEAPATLQGPFRWCWPVLSDVLL
jgi:hypothetical protein